MLSRHYAKLRTLCAISGQPFTQTYLRMQWSKLKQTMESKFADSVKGRVQLFSTAYRKPKSNDGRGWITVDKEEIVNFSTIQSWRNFGALFHEATMTTCLRHSSIDESSRSADKLIEDGEFSRFDLHNCCWEYLNLTVEEGLEHKSPLINLFAVLDKRLGKRRLVCIDKSKLHPLTKWFYEFRLAAEKLDKEDLI
jgi:hypothetical protein